eukprot:COSAG06_NODE_70875_length_189_cov_100.711111_1_plen_35_part_01
MGAPGSNIESVSFRCLVVVLSTQFKVMLAKEQEFL